MKTQAGKITREQLQAGTVLHYQDERNHSAGFAAVVQSVLPGADAKDWYMQGYYHTKYVIQQRAPEGHLLPGVERTLAAINRTFKLATT